MRIAGTHTLVRVGDSIRKMYSRRHFMYDLGALLRVSVDRNCKIMNCNINEKIVLVFR